MTYRKPTHPANQYAQQQILNASPAQQLVMLYDGAIKFTLKAKEAIEAGDIAARHAANRRAMEIVAYLLEILDVTNGGEVAGRLFRIYGFMMRKLLDVDLRNDPRACDEVLEHLRTLRVSWAKLAQQEAAKSAMGETAPPTSAVA